jgi:hypothetical protein
MGLAEVPANEPGQPLVLRIEVLADVDGMSITHDGFVEHACRRCRSCATAALCA